ncbi:MAG: hypothetical protein ACI841_003347 [Planctomycetota bacterium]|jgi:hypothetical protein
MQPCLLASNRRGLPAKRMGVTRYDFVLLVAPQIAMYGALTTSVKLVGGGLEAKLQLARSRGLSGWE